MFFIKYFIICFVFMIIVSFYGGIYRKVINNRLNDIGMIYIYIWIDIYVIN